MRTCCVTRFGQFENIVYKEASRVGVCQKCGRVFEREPTFGNFTSSTRWQQITFEINEEPW